MADQLTDVLVAGYPDVERATKEFDDLVAAVKAKTVRIEGAILVSHDKDGNVVVQQTGDHLGRKGLGYGGSVGFLVGLAAPPLLAATVVGAAAGGIAGRFAKHKMETGLHDKIGEALKPGTAAILAMFEEDQALAVQQVLAGALGALRRPDRQVGARPRSRTRSPRRWASSARTGPCCRSRTAPSAA